MGDWSVKMVTRPATLPIGGDDTAVDVTERLQSWFEDWHPLMGAIAGASGVGALELRVTVEANSASIAAQIASGVFRRAIHNAIGDDVDSRPVLLIVEEAID